MSEVVRCRSCRRKVPAATARCPHCGSNLRPVRSGDEVTPQRRSGEQALTPPEAVRAVTVQAAASLGAPAGGGIAPGQPADLAICSGDPFEPGTRVVQTWVAGQIAWAKERADDLLTRPGWDQHR